jgi:hypothetical protein
MLATEKSIGEGSFHSAIVPYRTQDQYWLTQAYGSQARLRPGL